MDYRGKTPKKLGLDWSESKNGILAISAKNIKHGSLINIDKAHYGNEPLYKKWMKDGDIKLFDILLTSEAPLGETYLVTKPLRAILSQRVFLIRPNINVVDPWYLYSMMQSNVFKEKLLSKATGTTVIGITQKELRQIKVDLPSKSIQKQVGNYFRVITEKIDLNNQINDNLLELNNTIFKNNFSQCQNYLKASDIAEIKIGKTPPRKESQWFSNKHGMTWLSIKDMKSMGIFAEDSSEKIVDPAIIKFNIQKVPRDTVMVSFKLTVGRVKIANHEMLTNEAIAQFENAKLPYQFLYTYLSSFPYETLGSTSSIARAINSKILRSMPILIPSKDKLIEYMTFAKPVFEEIRSRQLENKKLIELKTSLLEKYF